ncbi:MAG: hypothetical protein ACWIPH_05780, partial [Ostreibacterium sp.]
MRTFHTDELKSIWDELLLAAVPENMDIKDINTDSRCLKHHQTFFAVSGEQFDAHQFVGSSVKKGANAIEVTNPQL